MKILRKFQFPWFFFQCAVLCCAVIKSLLVGTTVWYVGGTSLHIVAAALIVGITEGSTKSTTGGTCRCNNSFLRGCGMLSELQGHSDRSSYYEEK